MVSRAQALAIVQAQVDTWQYDRTRDTLIVMEELTQETPYAWVVYWNSKGWLETQRLEYAYAGAGPFIVSKHTGALTSYSSAYDTKDALDLYEEENRLYGLRVTADLTDMRTRLLIKKLMQFSPQALLALIREPVAWVVQGARSRLLALQQDWLTQGLATELLPCF